MWYRVLWEVEPGRAKQSRDVPTWRSLAPSCGRRENRPWAVVGVRCACWVQGVGMMESTGFSDGKSRG